MNTEEKIQELKAKLDKARALQSEIIKLDEMELNECNRGCGHVIDIPLLEETPIIKDRIREVLHHTREEYKARRMAQIQGILR